MFVDVHCSRLFRSLRQLGVLDMHGGHTDVPTGRPGDDPRRNFPPSPISPGDGGVSLSLLVLLMGNSSRRSGITGIGHSPAMCFPRRDATPGDISAVEVGCRTVWVFSNIDFTPGECGVVELDFRRASFPPGKNGAEECDYIRPAPLAGSSVCAPTVTGSLLFGSPHRLVQSCLYSVVLSLFGGLTILIYPGRVQVFCRIISLEL